MRHPHGLRCAAGAGEGLPAIGEPYQGGYYAGSISSTANGVATHALIVAPAASGASGTLYPSGSNLQWKTSTTSTTGTTSPYDGAANSSNMNDADHPAAQFCEGLTIDGYSDWYLPARYELDIAYENLKPTTASNDTDWGINNYSVPKRTSNRSAGTPAQTTVAVFQSGGSEAFPATLHWSSTQDDNTDAWRFSFDTGTQRDFSKTSSFSVRAFRKVAL